MSQGRHYDRFTEGRSACGLGSCALLRLVVLMALLAAALCGLGARFAYAAAGSATPAGADPQCSLALNLHEGGSEGSSKSASGGEVALYQVALANDGEFEFSFAFSGCGENLDEVVAGEAAKSLAFWAQGAGVAPYARAEVASDGTAAFTGLASGIYLVVQTRACPGYYALDPFAVQLPMTSADGKTLLYDVEASPKVEPEPTESVAATALTVSKVWVDLGVGQTRADGTQASGARLGHAPVSVDLLKDGSLYATARLSADNGWTYTWDGLAADAVWSVSESQVPAGYAASYAMSGDAQAGWSATVTNTELAQKLIQTGQLKWPVPVLAGVGAAVFALGWWMRRPRSAAAGRKGSPKDQSRGQA